MNQQTDGSFSHSVELTKRQRSEYGWIIKVRYPGDSVKNTEKMVEEVKAIKDNLRKDFEAATEKKGAQ